MTDGIDLNAATRDKLAAEQDFAVHIREIVLDRWGYDCSDLPERDLAEISRAAFDWEYLRGMNTDDAIFRSWQDHMDNRGRESLIAKEQS